MQFAVHVLELVLAVWLIGIVLVAEILAGIFWWGFGLRYSVFFALIQLFSWILRIFGWFIIPGLALARAWHKGADGKWHWPAFFWLLDNEEDGIVGPGEALTRWNAIVWTAFRNSTNNVRYLPGISQKGRPFYRKTWGPKPGGLYVQAGWNSSGFPVISGGRNVNPF